MATIGGTAPGTYPVSFDIEPQLTARNRLTTGFRLILAVPQIVIVGGVGSIGYSVVFLRESGALATAAFTMAVISWFAIVFADTHPRGLWDFAAYYVRWWIRVSAYVSLLRDEYPPFGDEPYPTSFGVEYPTSRRDKLSVGLRLIYAIPHVVVLFFLNVAWLITTVIAWFSILFTGRYPDDLYSFAVGVFRWNVRLETYLLLMRDEYPPFRVAP